jgi:hypothetical protein
MHSGGRSQYRELSETCVSWGKTTAAMQAEDSCKGLSQLPSPAPSKALADGGAPDRTYILGFFLVLGLGALLIVVAWR